MFFFCFSRRGISLQSPNSSSVAFSFQLHHRNVAVLFFKYQSPLLLWKPGIYIWNFFENKNNVLFLRVNHLQRMSVYFQEIYPVKYDHKTLMWVIMNLLHLSCVYNMRALAFKRCWNTRFAWFISSKYTCPRRFPSLLNRFYFPSPRRFLIIDNFRQRNRNFRPRDITPIGLHKARGKEKKIEAKSRNPYPFSSSDTINLH